jgi:hypothetical protein
MNGRGKKGQVSFGGPLGRVVVLRTRRTALLLVRLSSPNGKCPLCFLRQGSPAAKVLSGKQDLLRKSLTTTAYWKVSTPIFQVFPAANPGKVISHAQIALRIGYIEHIDFVQDWDD